MGEGNLSHNSGNTMAKVLVIDDDRAVRHIVRQALDGMGYEILEAASADDGIAANASENPTWFCLISCCQKSPVWKPSISCMRWTPEYPSSL